MPAIDWYNYAISISLILVKLKEKKKMTKRIPSGAKHVIGSQCSQRIIVRTVFRYIDCRRCCWWCCSCCCWCCRIDNILWCIIRLRKKKKKWENKIKNLQREIDLFPWFRLQRGWSRRRRRRCLRYQLTPFIANIRNCMSLFHQSRIARKLIFFLKKPANN